MFVFYLFFFFFSSRRRHTRSDRDWSSDVCSSDLEVSAEAQSLVQLRQRVVEPRGEARSDTEIVFDLACRLGLGAHFWDGDIEAAYRYQLGPSGVSLDALRENSSGVRAPVETHYRKF